MARLIVKSAGFFYCVPCLLNISLYCGTAKVEGNAKS
jgi:hypothetical protein